MISGEFFTFLFLAGFSSFLLQRFILHSTWRRFFSSPDTSIPASGGIAIVGLSLLGIQLLHLVPEKTIIALCASAFLIIVFGLWDTRKNLPPLVQLGAQIGSAWAFVSISDIAIHHITHPFGGLLLFSSVGGTVITLVWIVFLMNAINFLDGTDGLAGSVSTIAFLTIAGVSMLPQVHEPHTATMALLLSVLLCGFLVWNISPARVYLGTTGVWWIGLLLGFLSVEGSSKIATTAVVGALPVLDVLLVLSLRLVRRQSLFQKDRSHLHHFLLSRGWMPTHILLLFVCISLVFGGAAILLPTIGKGVFFFALLFLAFLTLPYRIRHLS